MFTALNAILDPICMFNLGMVRDISNHCKARLIFVLDQAYSSKQSL